MNIQKVVRIGTTKDEGSTFCEIKFKDGKLSITGVEGPTRGGNARGSCGQIVMGYKEYDHRGYKTLADIKPAPGWDTDTIKRFFDVWDRWHLNDMKAGTPAQERFLREHPITDNLNHYTKSCEALAAAGLNPDPETGYKYGSAWLREEVPEDALEFLASLPETDVKPAWV